MIEQIESSHAEFELAKEILVPNFKVLIISGDSGTGKSTLGKGLAELLNIKIIDVGKEIRKKTEEQTGEAPVGFAARKIDVDIEFDDKIAEIVRNAANGEPIILVARMGPWVAKKEEVKARELGLPFPRVVTMHLSAGEEEKRERIREREHIEHPEMINAEIDQKTFLGNNKNQENWHLAHPDLEGNPLDPNATYLGEEIYRIKMNADQKKEAVLLEAEKILKTNNYLLKKPETTENEFFQTGDFFDWESA